MLLFGLATMAMAQDDLELLAIAKGDLDCSGSVDQAILYTNKDGDLIVEIAQGVPEKELLEPISPLEGPTISFLDVDEDKCEDLLLGAIADDGEQGDYLLNGAEHKDMLEKALEGEGDSVPDTNVYLRRPLKLPGATLSWGSGRFKLCDWDKGCEPDPCEDSCFAWGWGPPRYCDPDGDGKTEICYSWQCVSWKQHCI